MPLYNTTISPQSQAAACSQGETDTLDLLQTGSELVMDRESRLRIFGDFRYVIMFCCS